MTERAAFIGRFQPLHKGHKKVIEKHQDKHGDFVVAIGSAGKSGEEKNPLTLEERKEIIHECFPGLEIIGLEDEGKSEADNQRWIEKLEEEVDPDIVISQNKLVQRLINDYSQAEIKPQKLYDPELYSGTEIRRRIRSDEEWRYLIPECAKQKIEEHVEEIKETGIKYEFDPGWEKENAYHGTAEE